MKESLEMQKESAFLGESLAIYSKCAKETFV